MILPLLPKCKIGNVELTNMQLKPEALNELKLPVKVKAGFLGSVKLKVCRVLVSRVQCILYLKNIIPFCYDCLIIKSVPSFITNIF